MKRIKFIILIYLITLYLVVLTGCNKSRDTASGPAMPPSTSIDMEGLTSFSAKQKSAPVQNDSSYFIMACNHIQVWDSIVNDAIRVPKQLFIEGLSGKDAVYDDVNQQWSWTYIKSIIGEGKFEAVISCKEMDDSLYWTMTVSSVNNAELYNYKWLEGKTDSKQTGGWWVLYYPNNSTNNILINWSKESEIIKWIKYTSASLECCNNCNSILYGTKDTIGYNAYFEISMEKITDCAKIEWNKTTFAGRLIYNGITYSWDSNMNNACVSE